MAKKKKLLRLLPPWPRPPLHLLLTPLLRPLPRLPMLLLRLPLASESLWGGFGQPVEPKKKPATGGFFLGALPARKRGALAQLVGDEFEDFFRFHAGAGLSCGIAQGDCAARRGLGADQHLVALQLGLFV